ncbi:hypothetical protein ACRYCC_13080 [Actinomadura scrupuli]|uniref:hypothetical protein n=1 Tax=Actinomadura scrupuli TaxID=559629 RepID=UPI003D975897
MPDQRPPGPPDRLGMVLLAVDGDAAGLIHRSVLDRVADLDARLGCVGALTLRKLPTVFEGGSLRRLRRDLEQIIAFADAARSSGWALDELTAAPGDDPVPVLDDPRGRIWAHPVRGFELHGKSGVQRVTELPQMPGATARRVPLTDLIVPLVEAAARARVLAVYEHPVDGP